MCNCGKGSVSILLNVEDPEQIRKVGESLIEMARILGGMVPVAWRGTQPQTGKPCQFTGAGTAPVITLDTETDGVEPGVTNIGPPPMPPDLKEDSAAVQEATAEEQAPPPASTAITVKLDKEGLPWDARIHSENRGVNKTGEWRLRRNVDKELVEKVKAELRAAMSATIPLTAAPAAPAAPAPVTPSQPAPVTAPPTPVAPAPAAPAAPATPPPPSAAPGAAALDFPAFIRMMLKAGFNGDTMKPHLPAGIEAVPLLASRPDLFVDLAVRMFGYQRTAADPAPGA